MSTKKIRNILILILGLGINIYASISQACLYQEFDMNQLEKEVSIIEGNSISTLKEQLASAPIYKKNAYVKARIATDGEKIVTILSSGIKETEKTAQPGDIIITNPDGEEYIVDAEVFYSRNTPIFDENGQLQGGNAKGYIKMINNPFHSSITMSVPWGTQNGDKNCKIAATYDIDTGTLGEPYIIEYNAFVNTYKPCNISALT